MFVVRNAYIYRVRGRKCFWAEVLCSVHIKIVMGDKHRIINDRIEKSIKERGLGHCAFAASIFKVHRLHQY